MMIVVVSSMLACPLVVMIEVDVDSSPELVTCLLIIDCCWLLADKESPASAIEVVIGCLCQVEPV